MLINPEQINDILAKYHREDAIHVKEVLSKAREAHGLTLNDVAALIAIQDPELIAELFTTAKQVKEEIYGNRLVLFAPLYISNLCANECLYCAFRASNKTLIRRTLTQQEIAQDVTNLIEQGQKRLLLEAGETYPPDTMQYILDAISTIYQVKSHHGEIRRINVNVAPLTLADFKRLKAAEIGTYQLFQETYNPKIYQQVHVAGKKADYDWRLTAIDRAMEAGIDDVGIGALFGLADWRFEVLALLQHSQHLDNKFGVGPHTISVPRIQPASGSEMSCKPPFPVSDFDFKKIIAILRLAVPFTGIILTTRENATTRREALELGVSQISAGSKTNPGGYSSDAANAGQFSLGDHRSIDEIIRDIAALGYVPSFCTACYRLGRTGEHFMDLAKSGKIKTMCHPNALVTFAEYLSDYATTETKQIGEKLIKQELDNMPGKQRELVNKMIQRINAGERDVYI